MRNTYKVRAYCSSRSCDYVRKQDVIEALNYESCYSVAMMLNGLTVKTSCPACGEPMQFYPYTFSAAVMPD
jgi:NAD(P)H-nitrite reductase large subunit